MTGIIILLAFISIPTAVFLIVKCGTKKKVKEEPVPEALLSYSTPDIIDKLQEAWADREYICVGRTAQIIIESYRSLEDIVFLLSDNRTDIELGSEVYSYLPLIAPHNSPWICTTPDEATA